MAVDHSTTKQYPGTIYKRGNVYWLRFQRDKRRNYISLETSDINEAESRAKSISTSLVSPIKHKEQEGNLDWRKKMLSSARKRSELNGTEFTITLSDIAYIEERSGGKCEVSGIKFSWNRPEGCRVAPFIPSLDRINPSKGYTRDNIRLVCWAANIGMSDWGEEIFRFVCKCVMFGNIDASGDSSSYKQLSLM